MLLLLKRETNRNQWEPMKRVETDGNQSKTINCVVWNNPLFSYYIT